MGVLDKAQFGQRRPGTPMNARQTLVLNRVLDGMEGKHDQCQVGGDGQRLADTTLRDINDLLARGVLGRLEGGGVPGIYWSNKANALVEFAQAAIKGASSF